MSLLDMLLQDDSNQSRALQVLATMQPAGTPDPRASADMGSFTSGGDNPWGIDPNGMDLLTRHGVTLDADAMASLRQAAHATGIKPWQYVGSDYRSVQEQAGMYADRAGRSLPVAPPGQSMHNFGLAFDQAQGLPSLLQNWLTNHGWYNGASFGDPVHWSYGRSG